MKNKERLNLMLHNKFVAADIHTSREQEEANTIIIVRERTLHLHLQLHNSLVTLH